MVVLRDDDIDNAKIDLIYRSFKDQPKLFFLKLMICSNKYFIIALGYDLFLTLSDTPRMSPASRTKYYKSVSSHLFVN